MMMSLKEPFDNLNFQSSRSIPLSLIDPSVRSRSSLEYRVLNFQLPVYHVVHNGAAATAQLDHVTVLIAEFELQQQG